jgi:putative ABC transport system substrate-binding protein
MKKAAVSSILIAAILLAVAVIAEAQQPKKVLRIGYLSGGDAASVSARSEAIRLALRERGYIEGQNIATEYRYAEGKRDRAPELVAELVRLKVDLIVVAGGGWLIRAAMNATKTIPIVNAADGVDLSRQVSLKALPGPAATSPAFQTFPEN